MREHERDAYRYIHSGLTHWFYSLVFLLLFSPSATLSDWAKGGRAPIHTVCVRRLPDQQSCPTGSPVVGLLWWFVLEKGNMTSIFLHFSPFSNFLSSFSSFYSHLTPFYLIRTHPCFSVIYISPVPSSSLFCISSFTFSLAVPHFPFFHLHSFFSLFCPTLPFCVSHMSCLLFHPTSQLFTTFHSRPLWRILWRGIMVPSLCQYRTAWPNGWWKPFKWEQQL